MNARKRLVASGEWSVVSGQWPLVSGRKIVVSEQWPVVSGGIALATRHSPLATSHSPLATRHSSLATRQSGFTLIEILVVITIIAILVALTWGALSATNTAAREHATRATIAKLHNIIMERYESYLTRRVPQDLSTDTSGTPLTPTQIALDRLYAIRDLMRMEMPDRADDVYQGPITLPNSQKSIPRPPLSQVYLDRLNAVDPTATIENGQAELLYMIVSMGSPEAMEQFSQSEIGDTNRNRYPEFLDGWGRPIFFLRWAPGFSPYSGIQVANVANNHDPFDSQHVDGNAYQLFPIIYSAAGNWDPGLNVYKTWAFTALSSPGDMFGDTVKFVHIGEPIDTGGNPITTYGGITNHDIETR